MNIFLEPILTRKSKFDIKSYIKLIKVLRLLKRSAPDFNMLMSIYEFLVDLHDIYMYNIDMGFHISAGSLPYDSYIGSIVYREDTFKIIYLLSMDKNNKGVINIEMSKNSGTNKDKILYKFIDGEMYNKPYKYDEQRILFIEACLMNSVSNLIKHYYKNKKF